VHWARHIEACADRGVIGPDPKELKKLTLSDLIRRYMEEITPRKKGARDEAIVLNALLRQEFVKLSLAELGSEHLSTYRDERLKSRKAGTVIRQFVILQHLFNVAITDWGIPLPPNRSCTNIYTGPLKQGRPIAVMS